MELLSALRHIWECEPEENVLTRLSLFKENIMAQRVLVLCKWFFIEQDVTYWTESGRHMLRHFLEAEFGEWP